MRIIIELYPNGEEIIKFIDPVNNTEVIKKHKAHGTLKLGSIPDLLKQLWK